MWYKLHQWHSKHDKEITWFLIGALVFATFTNLLIGNIVNAVICLVIAFVNFKVQNF